jgi:hypothetical protein
MLVVPALLRWTSALFGLATIALVIQAANRAYVAGQFTESGESATWQLSQTAQSLTLALSCLTAAVLPVAWWTITRRTTAR